MNYFEIPTGTWFSFSFTISGTVYRAEKRTLSTSGHDIWSVRDTEGNQIFNNLYMSTGVNYARLFADFEPDTSLKIIEASGKKYIEATE